MRTIVIGIGNPILTDDSVGIKVAVSLKDLLGPERLPDDKGGRGQRNGSSSQNIDVRELSAGGIRLMEAMAGYDRALIIDAMVTGRACPGTIHRLQGDDLTSTRNAMSVHDMNLPTAMEMGRLLGIHLPSRIRIWGIEARDVETFSEGLTEDVSQAMPVVVNEILDELGKGGVHGLFSSEAVHLDDREKATIMEPL